MARRYAMKYCLLGAVILLFCSCRHKDLWFGSGRSATVNIAFDWSEATEREQGTIIDVWLFERDDAVSPILEQKPEGGGPLLVPFGNYRALAYNADSGTLRMKGEESWETLYLYTRDESILAPLGVVTKIDLRAAGAAGERVVLSPEKVWSGRLTDMRVRLTDEDQSFVIGMRNAFMRLNIVVRGIENYEFLSGVSFAISGLAEGYYVGEDRLSHEPVTIPFEGWKTKSKSYAPDGDEECAGTVLFFGHCPDGVTYRHFLNIYAVMSDGQKLMYTYDVTEQMHDPSNRSDDGTQISIIIDGLPLPTVVGDSGLLHNTVDEWASEEIEIRA